uniref:Uncharacterized protein n=1 Tax=Arundo donax TaxID=35708 RepID=A0A0A9C6K6_ARUDO
MLCSTLHSSFGDSWQNLFGSLFFRIN